MTRNDFLERYEEFHDDAVAAWNIATELIFSNPALIAEAFNEGEDFQMLSVSQLLLSADDAVTFGALGRLVHKQMIPYLLQHVADEAERIMFDRLPVNARV